MVTQGPGEALLPYTPPGTPHASRPLVAEHCRSCDSDSLLGGLCAAVPPPPTRHTLSHQAISRPLPLSSACCSLGQVAVKEAKRPSGPLVGAVPPLAPVQVQPPGETPGTSTGVFSSPHALSNQDVEPVMSSPTERAAAGLVGQSVVGATESSAASTPGGWCQCCSH